MPNNADALMALAERVEAATGADRELDRSIAAANGWCIHPADRQRDDSVQSDRGYTCLDCGADSWGNTGPTGQKRGASPPAYTHSLDAAMSLVPSKWKLRQLAFSAPCADDRRWHLNLHGGREGEDTFVGRGATPALALTCAALRAPAQGADHAG